jgi:hypothetical protein
MKTIKIKDFAKKLENFKGTTFIGMTTLTTQDEYYKGIDPETGEKSAKKVNKMITREGINPDEIKKQAESTVLLTSCSYKQLLENIRDRELDKDVLEFLEITETTTDEELMIHDLIEEVKKEEYELGERKNGTNLNNILVLSRKDNHPMINVYFRSNNKPKIKYFLNGEEFDTAKIEAYKKPAKQDSQRQKDFGIKKPLTIRNYRLENVKFVTWAGETYELVA